MKMQSAIVIALIMSLSSIAMAADPLDTVTSQVSEQVSAAKQDLTQKAVEHIVEGNLTKEHISQDVNATKEELKQKAISRIEQEINTTSEQISQRAVDEAKKQASQMAQQPGFEVILSLMGITAVGYLLRRVG